jgi:hypothetical protein
MPAKTKAPPKLPWRPMNEMPSELRDGRTVLLWSHADKRADALRCSRGYWIRDNVGFSDECFTHFCEITPPEAK